MRDFGQHHTKHCDVRSMDATVLQFRKKNGLFYEARSSQPLYSYSSSVSSREALNASCLCVLVSFRNVSVPVCLSHDAKNPLYRFLDSLMKNEKGDEALIRSSLADRQESEDREYEMPSKPL